MDDNGIDLVDGYLSDAWITAWAAAGVEEVEEYLSKQAAFEAFLDGES